MRTSEIITLIKVGFDKPGLYKRSVWNKAIKVMEFLSDTTNGEVVRIASGFGLEKYKATVGVDEEKLSLWALSYLRNVGEPICLLDAAPEFNKIARELNTQPCDAKVYQEYFNRYSR